MKFKNSFELFNSKPKSKKIAKYSRSKKHHIIKELYDEYLNY